MTHPTDDRTHLEVLYRDDCIEHLRGEQIGRVGFLDGDEVTVLPVNFIVHDEAVVFRTAQGAKLDAAASGQVLAFEVDGVDHTLRVGWSVLVRGRGELLEDQDLINTFALQQLFPWARTPKDHWVKLPLDRVTGRRIRTVEEQNRMDPRSR